MLSLLLFLLYLAIVSLIWFTSSKWWLRVETQIPKCTYYFGPFESESEALNLRGDYLSDLEGEGAQGITYQIQRGAPRRLTVCEEDG